MRNHWRPCSAKPEYVRRLEDNLEDLRTVREELMKLKNDAERVRIQKWQRRLKHVEVWQSRVQERILEIDKLIRDGQQEFEKLSLRSSCFKYCRSSFSRKLEKMIARKLEDLNILKGIGEFKFEVEPAKSDASETSLDDVFSYMMEGEAGVIGLIGERGVGKTTLLKQIYSKLLVTANDFDVVIWAEASDGGNRTLQKDIWTSLGFSDKEWKNRSDEEKCRHIFNVLQKKRFVLFLDGAQGKNDLVKIGVPIPKFLDRSKIVFASQNLGIPTPVPCTFHVSPLGSEQACKLFRDMVGEEILKMHPNIPLQAQLIAKACDGLPRTLNTIARAMASKKTPQEWAQAFWFLNRTSFSKVFIYNCLPNDKVKFCFLYFALFHKGFKICKDLLVDYWICENFWDGDDDGRDYGYDIINSLVQSNLLEDGGKYVTMNDEIHELAQWIASIREGEKEWFLVKTGSQSSEAPDMASWRWYTRISLMNSISESLLEVPVCPVLATLILSHNPRLVTIADDFFKFMSALTVLDLSNSSVHELPLVISNLVYLQYLNLSCTWIEQLPLNLKTLSKLKCLNLEHNDLLRIIPRQVISGLSRLQVLRMFGCGVSLVEDEDNMLSYCNTNVEELQNLENLNVLSITITSFVALRNFFNAQKLASCTKALSLKCFWGKKSLNLTFIANMEHLGVLEISNAAHLEEIKVDFVIESREIQEPDNLYRSRISMEKRLDNLQEVIVGKCFHLQDLTWLILAPNLTVLRVTDCKEMEEIISLKKLYEVSNAFEDLNPFAKLEVLALEELPRLNSIYWHALPLPFIQKMMVLDCPMLKKLPFDANSTKGLGFIITGKKHWWESLEWEDDGTRIALSCRFVEKPEQ